MTYTTFIKPDILLSHIGDPMWVIVDCRFELTNPMAGERAYLEAHIPGSVFANLEFDLSAPLTETSGRHPLPSNETMASLFGRWGIDDNVQVLAYDSHGGGFAARLWWALRYLGHDAVAILEGGFPAWERAGYPTRSGKETREATQFMAQERPAMRIDVDELIKNLDNGVLQLIDSRAPERYRGEEEPLDPVAGHIPGAKNHFWGSNLNEDGNLLPVDALKSALGEVVGDRAPNDLVFYCGSGVTGCFNLLVMAHLGLNGARLYPGSWSAWITDPDRPIVVGPEP